MPAQTPDVTIVRVGTGIGYNGSAVNSTSFRTDPMATHGDLQYVAFYDENQDLILARRTIGTDVWTVSDTGLTADIADAHRTASLAVDGDGYLHLSWGHHNEPLNYVRSTAPGALTLTGPLSMPGIDPVTARLTYPEFFYLPDGNLFFTYRLGSSGNGDTYIQRSDRTTQTWTLVQDPAILGRTGDLVNAYPNGIARDARDRFHWTWTWREDPAGPDANHDQLYARTPDFGQTWTRNDGTPYAMPITEDTAEIVWPVPQGSYLANQCHMTVDRSGRPMIAQHYDPGGGGRVMLTWFDGSIWRSSDVTDPTGWTRPLVLVDRYHRVLVIYRRLGSLRLAYSSDPDRAVWNHVDLASSFMGNDPVFDRKRFDHGDGMVNVFYQRTDDDSVNVLEWDPDTFAPPPPPTTEERGPVADTYVRDGVHAAVAYGADDRVLVKLDREDFNRETFLRFDVSGLTTIRDARLQLMPIATGGDGATTELVFELVEDDDWGELTTTWNTRPSGAGHVLGTHTGLATGVPVTVDVTSDVLAEAVADGLLSIRVSSPLQGSRRIVHFGSREHAVAAKRPRLLLNGVSNAGPGHVGATLAVAKTGGDELVLSWGPSCSEGAIDYGIYEGSLDGLGAHIARDCFDDGADRRELLSPLQGNGYFLVVASDPHAEGSYGTGSSGQQRPRGFQPCRTTQYTGACP